MKMPPMINAKRVAAEMGNAAIMLALDGVSDTSPMNLMNCLSESGTLVSYGGTSRKPMVVSPASLIFKKQTIRGFFTGINQPSRMRSRRCSNIWRR
jgi:NADPH:quinone reductase-like Zn-dependent oxidoreductase